jgi:DNA-binding NtrC family response regulator
MKAGAELSIVPDDTPPLDAAAAGGSRPFKAARLEALRAFEREYLLDLIEHHDSLASMSRASGVTRKHLRNLLRKHRLRDQVPLHRGGRGSRRC